jgi:hypothetical protein
MLPHVAAFPLAQIILPGMNFKTFYHSPEKYFDDLEVLFKKIGWDKLPFKGSPRKNWEHTTHIQTPPPFSPLKTIVIIDRMVRNMLLTSLSVFLNLLAEPSIKM